MGGLVGGWMDNPKKKLWMDRFRNVLLFLIKRNCIKKFMENSDRLPEDGGRRFKSGPDTLD